MTEWHEYPENDGQPHTVVGRVLRLPAFRSPELENERDLFVYLPPSYATDGDRRYPVLYMQDGQNLFDDALAYSGEWGVDQTLETAGQEGREAIVVAVPNMGAERFAEYCPFDDAKHGAGKGAAYVSFLVNTLKPRIDADFRTLPGRLTTGVMGSSMGALISLYAFFAYPTVFGFAGAMSPAVWPGEHALLGYLDGASTTDGRLYLDVGTKEGADEMRDVKALVATLERKGFTRGDRLCYVSERGGEHNESHWGRRFRQAFDCYMDAALGAAEEPARVS